MDFGDRIESCVEESFLAAQPRIARDHQMKARIIIGLVISGLLAPGISQAAEPIDEQFQSLAMPGANSLGFQANESNFAKTEVSTWFNFTTSDGTPKGSVTNIAICNTGKEPGCAFTVWATYRAILPACVGTSDTNCLSEITAINADGKSLKVNTLSTFPAFRFEDFEGDLAQGVPRGSGAVLVSIPEAPHAGGDNYLMKLVVTSNRTQESGGVYGVPSISASMMAVKIVEGKFRGSRTETNTASYPKAQGISVRGVTNLAVGELPDPRYLECVMSSTTECALPYGLPQDISFGFSARFSFNLTGWLHGRMRDASIKLEKKSEKESLLTVSARAIKVPVLDVVKNVDELPDSLLSHFAPSDWAGETLRYPLATTMQGTQLLPSEKNRAGLKNISFKFINTQFNTGSMSDFLQWLPIAGDKAAALPTQWRVSTMTDRGSGVVQDCLNKGNSLAGLVTTNSTMYIDGPPTYDASQGSLDYKVASTHYEADGKTEFKGTYELLMSSSVARCIYKFTNAPIKATVSVTSENGVPNVATIVVNEKNNWLTLAAYNFTFSAPTVSVKLTQDKPKVVTPPKPVIKKITCVKGKVTKKITATKCPTGYKKV